MQLSIKDYIRSFDRVNLCSEKWSIKEARIRATELLKERLDQERIDEPQAVLVILGSKVAKAFGLPFEPFTVAQAGRYAIIPHPSGLNRLWNEHGSYERARETLRLAKVLP